MLVSDGLCRGQPSFQGFAVALWVPDAATAERLFEALAEGGQVQMPLAPTFFSPALRHGGRPVRRALDGGGPGLSGTAACARRPPMV